MSEDNESKAVGLPKNNSGNKEVANSIDEDNDYVSTARTPASGEDMAELQSPFLDEASSGLIREPSFPEVRGAKGGAVQIHSQNPSVGSSAELGLPSSTSQSLRVTDGNDKEASNSRPHHGSDTQSYPGHRHTTNKRSEDIKATATTSLTNAATASRATKAGKGIGRSRYTRNSPTPKPGAVAVQAGSETGQETLKQKAGIRRFGVGRAQVAARAGLASATTSTDNSESDKGHAKMNNSKGYAGTGNDKTSRVSSEVSGRKTNVISAARDPIGDSIAQDRPVSAIEEVKVRAAEARRKRHTKNREARIAVTPGAERVNPESDRAGPTSSKTQKFRNNQVKSTMNNESHSSIPIDEKEGKGVGGKNAISTLPMIHVSGMNQGTSGPELDDSTETLTTPSARVGQEVDRSSDNENRATESNHDQATRTNEVSTLAGTSRNREVLRSTPGVERTIRDADYSDNDESSDDAHPVISATLVSDQSMHIETVTAVKDKVGRRRLIYGCGIVIVIALIVATAVSLTLRRSNNAGSSQPSSMPSSMPSTSPTFSSNGLVTLLSSASTDNGVALKTPGTAQSQALTWLVNQPFSGDYSDSRLIQRYALATLYFAMNGDRWFNNDNWLTEQNECDWSFPEGSPCDNDGRVVHINLSLNFLTDVFPPEIGLLTDMTLLDLSLNAMIGKIPSEVGLLTKLESLVLTGNRLTGTIPFQLANLNKLTTLALDGNSMTGSFPVEITLLTNLVLLRLQTNAITGTLPASIGNCTSLKGIYLSTTGLSGNIPSEIGALTLLEEFVALDTILTGTMPSEMGDLRQLSKFIARKNERGLCCVASCLLLVRGLSYETNHGAVVPFLLLLIGQLTLSFHLFPFAFPSYSSISIWKQGHSIYKEPI